ncbi:hypothetical protein PHJA_001354900 [Phtheirospermum japonicum]|uniref:Uncharacterized protein n=1 Tax=Phtheirospermum japonicum TaxID=374723 RepID=A0A830C4R7_9LAMI|nr:hypothetical protein PHJA_001354900 [Phtheirospermum japonicum]
MDDPIPHPVNIARIRQFRLGEGVDMSGVTTKIVSCNCSMDLIIDNNSKLFALHIHPPDMEILFGHLPFAEMQGKELYAGSNDITLFRLSVGTRNKPMYGAGRNMQDLLQSGEGLPLVLRVSFRMTEAILCTLRTSHSTRIRTGKQGGTARTRSDSRQTIRAEMRKRAGAACQSIDCTPVDRLSAS